MPFTFSHPAIVLPFTYLSKKRYSLTGLVIGSLTPDFEYFLRMSVKSCYSHTVYGLFWFDLPLGLLLAFIYHNVVRESLIANLPIFLKSKLICFSQFKWNDFFYKNWLVVIVSILIGALSHVFWDGFTHEQGYFVQNCPLLIDSISLFNHSISVFKILQHASSGIGAIAIAFAIYKMPSCTIEFKSINYFYWVTVVLLSFIIVGTRLWCGLDYHQYGNVIVSIIAAFIVALVVTPWVFVMTKYRG